MTQIQQMMVVAVKVQRYMGVYIYRSEVAGDGEKKHSCVSNMVSDW